MKSIGKYQVIEQFGASATGATFKVRDSFRSREFALKLLETIPGLSPAAKEKACAHLSSCSELAHRNIIKVHDLGEVEEGLFVVSELRTGMDLGRFMEQNQELPLVQKLGLVAQMAEGLAFAHSREIPHGNLKPGNVFVDGARDVSILDFGSANWLAALLGAGRRPENLVVNYLAPEQILGNPFDARSDIFALGVMLYEFAAGKYPFSAAPSLIPREIVHSQAEPLRKLDPQIPPELEQLVNRALHKDPEQRLQTAEEFAAGLYVAAQELRRRASAAPAVEATPPPRPLIEIPAIDAPAPEANPEPTVEIPTLPMAPAASAIEEPPRAADRPVRERPQDQTGPAQPWTARSYSAGAPLAKETAFALPQAAPSPAAPEPRQQAALPPNPAARIVPPNALPVQQAPVRPPSLAARPGPVKISKRAVAVVAGLILAVGIVGSFISRQHLKASQKSPTVSHVTQPSPARVVASPAGPQAAEVQPESAPKPGESGSDDVGNPEFAIKQTLNGPVRSLWEAGRYAEALALVDQVLADHPDNAQARTWKKKIADAQAAEAALK